MDPIKRFRRYAVYLRLPTDLVKRIARWFHLQMDKQGDLGCHALLKRVCTQLRYWLIAKADGVKCVARAPWVAVTGAGFPRLFSGLQTMSQDVLWTLTSLHKVFKPQAACELPPQAIRDRRNDVVRPFDGSRMAISDALSLISLGTRHLKLPEFTDYSFESGSIFDPNHELQSSGIKWLHAFYSRNKYWLAPVEAVQCFFPYNPTTEPDGSDSGQYEHLNREGKLFSVSDPSHTLMGQYQLTPEPGYKARAFFSPNLLVQACSEPIYRFLESIERSSGFSVRYLETEAKVSQIQSWLADGVPVSSIDQTSATDRFPLQLQLFTAYKLGVEPEYIRFISKVSRGRWSVDQSIQPFHGSNEIRLSVGQPMGVSFSMPLYTLSMISLLRGACERWGYQPDFLVLGDDLVVRDQGLAQWCHDFLPKIGVGISKSKGVTSCNIAEFAGAFVGKDYYTFPGKMPDVDKKSWYACSVRLAQPLPDGCPKASSSQKLVEAFWLSRVAALGCYGAKCCPLENGAACNTIIQQQGFTEDHLESLVWAQLSYDVQRLRDGSRSLVGSLNKGLITSKSDAIVRMCTGLVDNDYLYNVLGREDDLLRRGFSTTLSRIAFELHDVLGAGRGQGFESWLKPKGQTTAMWVAHTLGRVADMLKLDAPNWCTKYSSLDQRFIVSSLMDIVERLRMCVWERRSPEYKRSSNRSSSLCHFLVRM